MCTRIKNDVICECVFLVFVSFALNMMLFKKPVMQVVDVVILLCISILLFIFHLSSGLLPLFRAVFYLFLFVIQRRISFFLLDFDQDVMLCYT